MRVVSRRKGGFTLIEVLVALFIVSLGMLGVIEAVSQTAGNATRMRDRTIAHWVAMNRLTEVRLQPRAPDIAKTSDEVEMAGRRWRWTMEVSETPVETMRRIDIRVAEAEGDEDRTLVTVTGFYGSAVAPAGTRTPSWEGVPDRRRTPGQSDEPPQDEDRDRQDDPGAQPDPQGEPVDPPLPESESTE
jgi:general secretion pathway protein I